MGGSFHCEIDIFLTGIGHVSNLLFGGGVDGGESLARHGIVLLAIDEEFAGGQVNVRTLALGLGGIGNS